jgi:hypothetical protein
MMTVKLQILKILSREVLPGGLLRCSSVRTISEWGRGFFPPLAVSGEGLPLPPGVDPRTSFSKYWQKMNCFVHYWVRFPFNNCQLVDIILLFMFAGS